MKKALLIPVALAGLLWGAWLVAVPERVLVDSAEKALSRGRVSADVVGFRKGLWYSFRADALDIKLSGDRALSVKDIRGRLDFLRLFALKAVVTFSAKAGGGAVRGAVEITRGGRRLQAQAEGVEISQLEGFASTGLGGTGTAGMDFLFEKERGKLKFWIDDAKLKPLAIAGLSLPLNLFDTIRGAALLEGNGVEVESVSLEGKEMYARLTGSVKGRNVDLKLELMPEGDSFPDPLLGSLLERYRIARGHYVIPVRTELSRIP